MSRINKRQWNERQQAKQRKHISPTNDSRVFCYQAKRTKFLYENERKAKVALKFNRENGAVRYYVCDVCAGYHLTSKEAWEKR